MKTRQIDLLRKIAGQELNERRRAVQEQRHVVDGLRAEADEIRRDLVAQSAAVDSDPRILVMLAPFLDERRAQLVTTTAKADAAEVKLEGLVNAAREAFIDSKRFDILFDRQAQAAAKALEAREQEFMDWLAGRSR
ncbi:flagellar FliJ family protein [Azospirillum sp. SYSU D00513]|uniref:flagellar FliJ family protein n=1 Tax=Azospirillum sp. SYSU D00513 TaxID=2812561 RepID=UPI001A979B9F|nr:flagellar FliJ family protein [Azospirillum sp. SYSU D00513]